MKHRILGLMTVVAIASASVALAACGSSGDSADSASSATSAELAKYKPVVEPPADAQAGGELTILAASDVGPGYTDPGIAYYQFAYMVTEATQRALLSWQPDDDEVPTPDLSDGDPVISSDGKTLTFKIIPGVKFSPPVDREITSADIKYAIDRAVLPGVGNGYIQAYLGDLEGLKEAQAAAEKDPTVAPDISGVQTPDDQTLVLKFDRPSATIAVQALSLPISAPVPEEYAKEFDAEQPSTYADNVVGTGPYMIENDESGKLTGYQPNKSISLIRNPNWDPDTDWRPAYLDSVEIQEGYADPNSAAQKILKGSGFVNGDFPASKGAIKDFAEQAPEQMAVLPSGGNRYVSLNTQKPPFDDVNVRKAVLAAADRQALHDTRGGDLAGLTASHLIPPGLPGFEEAGGTGAPPGLDFLADPDGNPELAAEYMKKAGFDSGKCEGDCKITMVADDISPGKDAAQVIEQNMESIGFDVDLRLVTHDVMYTRFCNVPDSLPDVCPNVAWGKDFNDAQSILDPTFNGANILSTNNSNWPLLDDPAVNKAIDKAKYIVDPEERAQAWADVDLQIMALAPVVPYYWDNQPSIESADVNGVFNLQNAAWDVSFTSLKG